jgi:hypothetical protein
VASVGSPGPTTSSWMPQTALGRSSVVSFGVLVLGAVALFVAAASGQVGGRTVFDNLWLGVPGMIAFGGATTSMITGLIAVFGRHENHRSVVVAAVLSTLVFLFVVLSLIFG